MPQRLEFPVLPGADDESYWPKLQALIEFVDEARPDRREANTDTGPEKTSKGLSSLGIHGHILNNRQHSVQHVGFP